MKQEEKWSLPDRYRIDAQERTPKMERLLAESDSQQKELAEKYAAPFLVMSSRDKERARSSITIKELEAIGRDYLTDLQHDELAAAYATVGLYFEASRIAKNQTLVAEYEAIARALGIPDELWCDCGRDHAYAERDIFSIEADGYVALMRCSNCGYRNAKDVPDHVAKARARRQEIRNKYSGLHPVEARKRMEADRVNK